MNKSTSEAINLLRFPLACLIVLKHYYTPDISSVVYSGKFYHVIGELVTHVFTAFPVPLFLMISGYLYFNNCTIYEGFNKETYIKKTKSRIKSLLVPYLLWNLLVFALFSGMQMLVGGSEIMAKDGYKALSDYTLIDYFKNFWALDSTGMPVDGPLWFIRDLFIISLFSPLVYIGIKYLRWAFVCILCFWGYMGWSFDIPLIDCTFVVDSPEIFFSLGASLMLLAPDVLAKLKEIQLFIPTTIFYLIVLVGLSCCVFDENIGLNKPFLWGYRLFGALFFFACAELIADKGVIPTWLSTASFFIFAIHKPIQVIIRRLTFAIFHPTNEIVLTSLIFIIPTIVILISLLIFYIIKRWIPWLKCLNGYRL